MKDIEYLKEAVAKGIFAPNVDKITSSLRKRQELCALLVVRISLLGFHFSLSPPDT